MSNASREVITIFYLFGTRLGVDFIVRNLFLLDRRVQWSSGYDFCLTYSIHMGSYNTEGLQFDPGLNHFFVFPSHPKTVLHPNSDSLYYHKYDEKSRVCTMYIISTNDKRSKNIPPSQAPISTSRHTRYGTFLWTR